MTRETDRRGETRSMGVSSEEMEEVQTSLRLQSLRTRRRDFTVGDEERV